MSKPRKIYVQEKLKLEDVLEAKDIFITYGRDGVFFLNFDPWDIPEEAKIWYKFSIDPFDPEFLEIVKLEYGFLNKGRASYSDLDMIFRYLGICSDIYSPRSAILIYHVFFDNDTIKNIVNRLKNEIVDESLGVINMNKVAMLKNKIKIIPKNGSLEYIENIMKIITL